MDALEAILTTRSIRRFTDEPVTDDEVAACLEAGNQAPSGGNIQPWQFLVVRDMDRRERLAAIYGAAYVRYEAALLARLPPFRSDDDARRFERMAAASRHLAEHLADAPVLVLVLMPAISMTLHDDEGDLDVGTPYASVYPAVQNLMIAARALGIGTTLTTVYRIRQAEVRAVCAIPDRFEVVALVPMGRPQGRFGRAPRRPWEKVTHWDTYGNRRDRDNMEGQR